MLCYRLFYASLFLYLFRPALLIFFVEVFIVFLMMSAILVTCWCLIMFWRVLVSSVLKSLIICLVFGILSGQSDFFFFVFSFPSKHTLCDWLVSGDILKKAVLSFENFCFCCTVVWRILEDFHIKMNSFIVSGNYANIMFSPPQPFDWLKKTFLEKSEEK